ELFHLDRKTAFVHLGPVESAATTEQSEPATRMCKAVALHQIHDHRVQFLLIEGGRHGDAQYFGTAHEPCPMCIQKGRLSIDHTDGLKKPIAEMECTIVQSDHRPFCRHKFSVDVHQNAHRSDNSFFTRGSKGLFATTRIPRIPTASAACTSRSRSPIMIEADGSTP